MARAFVGSAAPLSSFSHLHHLRYPSITATSTTTSTTTRPTPAAPAVPKQMPPPRLLLRRKGQSSSSLEILGGGRDAFLPALKSLAVEEEEEAAAYKPFPVIGWNRHLETIFAALFRSVPEVRYRRECLRMKDDGSVALDWVPGDGQLPADAPLLILLPGLTGGSGDGYVRHMLIKARSNGWRVVVFNSRGCANSPVTTPQFYSGSFIEDAQEVVARISSRYPKANLYAVGWSLGANILIRYLGQDCHTCPLSGAVSLCNPFNLVLADIHLDKGFNHVYDRNLATALRKFLIKHAALFEDIEGEYNIPLAINAKTIKEFDEGLTRASFGFESADDYYQNSGSDEFVKHVRIPLLCIQASNDPIAPNRAIPRDDIRENPNCLLIVTPKGGHLGWVAGAGAPRGAAWTDNVVMEFLDHLERGRSEASSPQAKSEENVHTSAEGLQSVAV